GEFELSLCDAAHEFVPASAREPSAVILALGVDDVTARAEELESEGVAMLSAMEDEPWGQRHIFVQAPDGVALDLFELIPPDPTWMKAHGFA
ncbi:MAG: VOC family protein, partial [Myxococcota bacterium]